MSKKQKPSSLRLLFAKNVRLVRVNAAMSQEHLAYECDLDRTFISSVERGIRNISIDNVERIAAALHIAPRDLLDPGLESERGFDATLRRSPRSSSR